MISDKMQLSLPNQDLALHTIGADCVLQNIGIFLLDPVDNVHLLQGGSDRIQILGFTGHITRPELDQRGREQRPDARFSNTLQS